MRTSRPQRAQNGLDCTINDSASRFVWLRYLITLESVLAFAEAMHQKVRTFFEEMTRLDLRDVTR